MISYEDFQKIDLRTAKILEVERIEQSEKLLRLQVDLGEDPSSPSGRESRQIIAGIGTMYEPKDLVDREIVIVANLEPRMFLGFESQGMLIAADNEKGPVLLCPDRETAPGTRIR